MKKLIILAFLLSVSITMACNKQLSGPEQIAHGKYLVENVGLCADCHTPRNERGEFDKSRWLQGSQLGFVPRGPMPAWADTAPSIAGLLNMTEADATRFFETGDYPGGKQLRPPMPPYRMNHEDASAVAAYLKSLKPTP